MGREDQYSRISEKAGCGNLLTTSEARAQLREIESLIEVHHDEFKSAWEKHLGG
jgi:hypothetical protein